MPTTSTIHDGGVAEVVMDNPPVNALTVAGWFELADLLTTLGRDPTVRVVVLRAEGRGFNAGVDIKEMQATEGFDALIGANRGCFAAFAAVYDCPVPVIAAVNGYCLGGGIGLVGQRRRHRRRRRRHLRAPRGRPRRARCRHPPEPAGAPAQDAGDGVHVGHRHRPGAAPLRLGALGGARRRAARRRVRHRRADRRQVAHRDPRRQGEPQRHRPLGREALVPLRAGLHLRAQPLAAWPTSTATPSSRSATRTPTPE